MKRNFFVQKAFTGLKQIFTVALNIQGEQSKIQREGENTDDVRTQVKGELIDCGSQSLVSFRVLGTQKKWSAN